MKKYCIVKLLFCALLLVGISACSSGNDVPEPTPTPQPTPTPDPSDKVDVTSKPSAAIQTTGGDATIEFTASADWSASTSADWISISPTSGTAGSAKITVKVAENTTYDERNGSVTIKSGTASQNITITQKQKDAIILTSSKVEVNAEAGEATIEVKANVDYTFEIEESAKSWISAPQTRGLTASTIKLSVAENDGVNKREGKITITSGSLSEVVTIYQAGAKASIVISQNEYVVASSGDVIKVELQSNCDYEIRMPNVDWISKADTRAVSTYTHYFNVAENKTNDQREASIVFVNKESNIEESVKITQEKSEKCEIGGHEYVDLGLPSGTLWATCNIGASKPEEYGDYFAWGETKTKSEYTYETYKWCGGSKKNLTKYNTNSDYGTVDNKTELDVEDDAAYVNWGQKWRMPTWSEIWELHEKCTWEWTSKDGHNGFVVTGPNDNSIFLPAAGMRGRSSYYVGARGYYLSSELCKLGSNNTAFSLYFQTGYYTISGDYAWRDYGCSVRPVVQNHKPVVSDFNGHEYVDLGLSVKWATCNVGADKPEDYGGYYAWGETSTKSSYTWGNCFDCVDGNLNNWGVYKVGGKTKIEPNSSHDTARENWGGSWRMPTIDELEELNSKCTWTWTSKGGHYGNLLTGPNGNSIFLPAAGYRDDTSSYDVGEVGQYWSSTLSSSNSIYAHDLGFYGGDHYTNGYYRRYGFSVRPVTE